MLVTFYSYKGGVGRSMALANIACLLAEHEDHSQRVLLWDFDLDAPGLQQLFPPPTPHQAGFVDLAHEWARSGELPPVENYIHQSEVSGIDVLAAGRVNVDYCRTLERIDWSGFFTEDPADPGPFFGPLLDAIGRMEYDYVLVDSRTGLGDQAGICTQILPDLLVVLFRLNDQNLHGLAHFVPSTKDQLSRRKRKTEVLPVASVVSTTASEVVNALQKRARMIFDVDRLDYIRFDPNLVTEERLFARRSEQENVWPQPYVVADYDSLCRQIRERHEEDTLTQSRRLLSHVARGDIASASSLIETLLTRRSRLGQIWNVLDQLHRFSRLDEERIERILGRVRDADPDNPYAAHWRAVTKLEEAEHDEDQRIRDAVALLEGVRDEFPPALMSDWLRTLSRAYSVLGRLDDAAGVLREVMVASPDNAQVQIDLARLYLRRGIDSFTDAINALRTVPPHVDPWRNSLLTYLHAFFGQDGLADASLAAFDEMIEVEDWRRLVRAHRSALGGHLEDAKAIAEESGRADSRSPSNWSKFHLCIGDYDRARECVDRSGPKRDGTSHLRTLIDYISGESDSKEDIVAAWAELAREKPPWNFDELLMHRERIRRNDDRDLAERFDIIERLIRTQDVVAFRRVRFPWRQVAKVRAGRRAHAGRP